MSCRTIRENSDFIDISSNVAIAAQFRRTGYYRKSAWEKSTSSRGGMNRRTPTWGIGILSHSPT
ncbi:MAG: hypothetical protein KME32_23800 [Mojavia pulchra JT2-VF2]|uniref:Uncharacterized protein n=1 Tax=Mojavia pulchra JT2-VF2 TaxID=287848 RepID=A0A951UI26_9NOST|nr:hypothetical protein [Mojavia pulchra JT2-VF2]